MAQTSPHDPDDPADWGDYSHYYLQWHSMTQESLNSQAKARQGILQLVTAGLHRGHALDVGCGFGAGVSALQSLGFEAHGIDSSLEQVAGARSLGFPVSHVEDTNSYLESLLDGSCTLVTLIDVLEHIPKPQHIPLLRRIHRVLGPGGRLVVQVPNAASLAASYHLYQDYTHRLSFTTISLRYALINAGYTNVWFLRDKPHPAGWRLLTRAGRQSARRRLVRVLWGGCSEQRSARQVRTWSAMT